MLIWVNILGEPSFLSHLMIKRLLDDLIMLLLVL